MRGWRVRSVLLACVAAAGCADRDDNADSSSGVSGGARGVATGPVAGGSGLWWRNETYRELDGDDENAERLVATVSKGPLDSTAVRLEIRTSKDRLLYRHEWPAAAYVKYDAPGSARDSAAVLRAAELQMGRIFADSAFITGSDAPRYSGKAEADHDAIRYDVAEHEYRAAKSLKLWEPIPPGARAEIDALARSVPAARIAAIAAETRSMPAFRYYAGGEETYVVAWSTSERRMVRIAACC